MKTRHAWISRGVLALALACCMRAEVSLPYLIADHMVVQRGMPVHVWGKASPGERVAVSFRGAERADTADALGRWSVFLPPGDAGGPFAMSVRGSNAIALEDILVGEVWVASGQSNMEWPVAWAADAERETAAANHPEIRLVRAMHRVSEYPLDDLMGQMWRPCTPESVKDFSAVAYHFGRLLQQSLNVPIGLIQIAWGGTPVDSWISLGAISGDPALMPVFSEWNLRMEEYPQALLRYHRAAKAWERETASARAQHKPVPPPPEKPVGPRGPYSPAGLFNAMVAPATPFAIKGVIWYQGEANGSASRAPLYGRLFRTMIQDWRSAWGLGDFPFLFVQLANYNSPEKAWPQLREGQRQALALRNTAMAVTVDIGTPANIHPPDKKTVAERLWPAARALAYGEHVEYSGPSLKQATRESGTLRIWFDHAEGLTARGGGVQGFELAGPDGKFAAAEARIEGSTVVVRSPGLERPVEVRYGWDDNPNCNLYNAAGLPASPFREKL